MLMPELSADEVAQALRFLSLREIMPLRSVNKTWKDAAKKTIVPPTNFIVNSVKRCNAMSVMARVLPNLQQITLGYLGRGHKYADGEDPYEDVADADEFANWLTDGIEERDVYTANWATYDIKIISNFSKLRDFSICNSAPLNGRYPVFFNSFPLLQKLSLFSGHLKWDLDMLAGMPLLKELYCANNRVMSGNINSLRVLKGTLEKVHIENCSNVEGNFMDLANFPHLRELDLCWTAVTGDIRDIGDNDFSSLEKDLLLPKGVYGGTGYEFQRISDAPDLMRAVYLLKKQRPVLVDDCWYGELSRDSPDWYESVDEDDDTHPFCVSFVEAGSRIGYRWEIGDRGDPCEVNWLDPGPESGSSGYEDYVADYHSIRKAGIYRGYYDPPTEEEYNLLHEESDED